MAGIVWPTNAVAGSPSYTGRMLRQLIGAMWGGKSSSRPLGGRTGITAEPALSVNSTTWGVGAFPALLDVESATVAGAYNVAFDGADTGSVNAAHATLPRWDLLYVQVDDPAESDGTSTPATRIAYLAGTASASPSLPATPARSMPLAKITVPQSGGGSPTISLIAPYTAAAGGTITCRTSAEYPASPSEGMRVWDIALKQTLVYTGGAWTNAADLVTDSLFVVRSSGALNSGTFRYRKVGPLVVLELASGTLNATLAAGSSVTLTGAGGLPVGIAPAASVNNRIVRFSSHPYPGDVAVNADGSVVLTNATSPNTTSIAAGTASVMFRTSWFV